MPIVLLYATRLDDGSRPTDRPGRPIRATVAPRRHTLSPAQGRPHPRMPGLPRAVLLDGHQRPQDERRADPIPALADPGSMGLAELRRCRQLHPVRAVHPELADHHGRGDDWGCSVKHPRCLWLLEDPVARPQRAFLHLRRDDLPAIPGDPGGPLRHFRQAALVRGPGSAALGQHVPAPDRAGILWQSLLHLPDAAVHARHSA